MKTPKKKPLPKAFHSAAERAAEHFAHEVLECVKTRRATRAQFQSIDFFSCDVMGCRDDGSKVYIQVTCGGKEALRARRKKIEAEVWHPSEEVYLLELDRSVYKPYAYFFRIWRYLEKKWLADYELKEVPEQWFRKLK